MELKDLAGFSKPLTRLVEVLADGVGAIAHPYLDRKTADAKAYEIRTIAKAIEDTKGDLGELSYKDGKIFIGDSDSILAHNFENRTAARVSYQQAKIQQNIEAITANAAEELSSTTEVPESKPDKDWIARFFNTAETISSDELQRLWGRILAGEIKRPGSFSLRTLDLLKNITQQEAELFVKLSSFVIRAGEFYFVPGAKTLLGEIKDGISIVDIVTLQDAGLLSPGETVRYDFNPGGVGTSSVLVYGNIAIIFDREKATPKFGTDAVLLTKTGQDVLSLISTVPNMEFASKLAASIRIDGVRSSWAPITKIENGNIHFGLKISI